MSAAAATPAMSDGGGGAWTVSHLLDDMTSALGASDAEIEAMVAELHQEWVGNCPRLADGNVQVDALNAWACTRLDVILETVDPNELREKTLARFNQLKKLFDEVKRRGLEGAVQDQLAHVAKVMREARNTVQSAAILFRQLDEDWGFSIPEEWNPDSFFQHTTEDKNATNFQKLLVAVLKRLASAGLRRLDEDCYEAIVLSSGEKTHAWRRLCTIKQFVYTNIQKETDYEEWLWLTNPYDNGEKVAQHLAESPQSEFPTIEMNRYLWAYNNGLYNVEQDMFYPFAMPVLESFHQVSRDAILARCAHHVYNAETDDEIDDGDARVTADGVSVWNVMPFDQLGADSFFRIDGEMYLNHCGRESWPGLARDIQTYRRGMRIGSLQEVTAVGVAALPAASPPGGPPAPTDATIVDGVSVWYLDEEEDGALTRDTVFEIHGVYRSNATGHEPWQQQGAMYTCVAPSGQDVAVKYFETDFRFRITPEAEEDFDVHAVSLPEMERIMRVQDLTEDSQEWLLLMLCRLFFPVGYDPWQVVLFVRGVAGSGKSTMAQIIRNFYPSTCVTTLSSNIETRFGLSAIYKGLVCICAEVREDFGLDQAEWQSCVSGEEVQIAVKQRTAFAHRWTTPFFWLGNELPNYRNASGSVDRRFFMIEFNKKVRDSDPHLLTKFYQNIDLFQRKGVYLYHQALRKFRDKDIWAPGVVGPQLTEWRNAVKLASDMLYAFLTQPRFEYNSDLNYMPLDSVKDEYMVYRKSNGAMDNVKWTASHYQGVFSELGVFVETSTRVYPRGSAEHPKTTRWLIGVDVADDP